MMFRSDPKYLTSLGQSVINIIRLVPHGVLIFFPSYRFSFFFSLVPTLVECCDLQRASRSVPIQVCKFLCRIFISVVNQFHFGTDPDPRIRSTDLRIRIRIRILPFSSLADNMPRKCNFFQIFFGLLGYFFKVHTVYIIVKKKSQNSRYQVFTYFFCLLMEGSGFGIREAQKHRDPDPQH
jgi:hypothetical protein